MTETKPDTLGFRKPVEKAKPLCTLSGLQLSPAELKSLQQKGLIKLATDKTGPTKIQQLDKAVLNLVRLTNPANGVTVLVGLVLVDDFLAATWLKNNYGNRSVSDDVVDAYARDAINQQWVTTHQGVAFNDIDQLIDGQHRLLAIIKSAVPVVMMASFGWPAKVPGKEMTTMDAVDRGRPRSVSDQLRIQHGLKDATVLSAVCASLANLCCTERCRKLSVGNTLEIYRAFEPSVKWVLEHRSKQKGLRAAGVLGAFAFAHAACKDREKPEAWFKALNTGAGLKAGSPLERLRGFLTGEQQSLMHMGMNTGLAVMTCQALHLEANGRPGKELSVSENGVKYWSSFQCERVAKIAKIFELPKQV